MASEIARPHVLANFKPPRSERRHRPTDETELLNELRRVLHYSPDTGQFTWIARPNKRSPIRIGGNAGSLHTDRYWQIWFEGRDYLAHRLAWLFVHGRWPNGDIDHINGDGLDNRISNLRECTRSENMQNTRRPRLNTSGLVGVSWHKDNGRWRASIRHQGKQYHLGYFSNKEEAHAAYLSAKAELHLFQPTPRVEAAE